MRGPLIICGRPAGPAGPADRRSDRSIRPHGSSRASRSDRPVRSGGTGRAKLEIEAIAQVAGTPPKASNREVQGDPGTCFSVEGRRDGPMCT